MFEWPCWNNQQGYANAKYVLQGELVRHRLQHTKSAAKYIFFVEFNTSNNYLTEKYNYIICRKVTKILLDAIVWAYRRHSVMSRVQVTPTPFGSLILFPFSTLFLPPSLPPACHPLYFGKREKDKTASETSVATCGGTILETNFDHFTVVRTANLNMLL